MEGEQVKHTASVHVEPRASWGQQRRRLRYMFRRAHGQLQGRDLLNKAPAHQRPLTYINEGGANKSFNECPAGSPMRQGASSIVLQALLREPRPSEWASHRHTLDTQSEPMTSLQTARSLEQAMTNVHTIVMARAQPKAHMHVSKPGCLRNSTPRPEDPEQISVERHTRPETKPEGNREHGLVVCVVEKLDNVAPQ